MMFCIADSLDPGPSESDLDLSQHRKLKVLTKRVDYYCDTDYAHLPAPTPSWNWPVRTAVIKALLERQLGSLARDGRLKVQTTEFFGDARFWEIDLR